MYLIAFGGEGLPVVPRSTVDLQDDPVRCHDFFLLDTDNAFNSSDRRIFVDDLPHIIKDYSDLVQENLSIPPHLLESLLPEIHTLYEGSSPLCFHTACGTFHVKERISTALREKIAFT